MKVFCLSVPVLASFLIGTEAHRGGGGRGKTKQIFVFGDSFCDGGSNGDTPFGGQMGLERKKILELYQAQVNPGEEGPLNPTDPVLGFLASEISLPPFTENQFASGAGVWPKQLEESYKVDVFNFCVGSARVRQDYVSDNVCAYIARGLDTLLGISATTETCSVEVPGLLSQVEILEDMISTGDVEVEEGSLCTFFFGGNDYTDLGIELLTSELPPEAVQAKFFFEYQQALEAAKAKCEALGMEVMIGNTFSSVVSPFVQQNSDAASLELLKTVSTFLNQQLEIWFPGQIVDYDQALFRAEQIAIRKGKKTDEPCHQFEACATSTVCIQSCIGSVIGPGFVPADPSTLDFSALEEFMWLDPIHPTGAVQTDILKYLVKSAFKNKRLRARRGRKGPFRG